MKILDYKCKVISLWKLLNAKEWCVVTEKGYHASFKEVNYNPIIKSISQCVAEYVKSCQKSSLVDKETKQ